MSLSHIDRARVLSEALPYIRAFNGKTVVVKYGGNAMINEDLRRAVLSDMVLLHMVGIHVVVVHGGGPEISAMLKEIGKEGVFVNGLRYTDPETMDIVQQVLCGKVNKDLVSLINEYGGKAMGLSGMDSRMIEAQKKADDGYDYGLVGTITAVNTAPITDVLKAGYIPVISTVAAGTDGEKCYNINADTASAQIAAALGAEKLIILTDVLGVMRDMNDPDSLISKCRPSDVPGLVAEGVIQGGMIPKIQCCVDAVQNGVTRAHILDGRIEHSVLIELFTDAGAGTMIY